MKKGGRKSKVYYFVNGEKFSSLSQAARKNGVSTTSILNWCSDGKKSKTNCWKELKEVPHDGAKGVVTNVTKESKATEISTELYDAQSYLEAIVSGILPADTSLRVQAAKILLPYQLPKARIPKENPAPKDMRSKEVSNAEKNRREAYERKASKIIQLHEALKK